MFKQIQEFCEKHPQAKAYTSLGKLRYLSCMRHVDGIVGNSSSGLLEAPSFKKGTINIGDRQKGRLKAKSIIDCAPNRSSISNAIERMFSSQFQAQLSAVQNPYGDGGASEAIIKILESCSLNGILKKRFYNTSIS